MDASHRSSFLHLPLVLGIDFEKDTQYLEVLHTLDVLTFFNYFSASISRSYLEFWLWKRFLPNILWGYWTSPAEDKEVNRDSGFSGLCF